MLEYISNHNSNYMQYHACYQEFKLEITVIMTCTQSFKFRLNVSLPLSLKLSYISFTIHVHMRITSCKAEVGLKSMMSTLVLTK